MKYRLVGVCCLWLLASAANAKQLTCFNDAKATKVGMGDIRRTFQNGKFGSDTANAVHFHADKTQDSKLHALNVGINLNDPQGSAMNSMLLLSMIGGYRITAIDKNNDINCVDVDEIWISP